MHGGTKGSGAPEGNSNALKHGSYAATMIAERKLFKKLVQEIRQLTK